MSLIGSEEAFPESLASDDALAGRVLDSEGFKARILARRAYAKGLFEDAALREDAAADAKWVSLIGSEGAFPESLASDDALAGRVLDSDSRPAFSRGGPYAKGLFEDAALGESLGVADRRRVPGQRRQHRREGARQRGLQGPHSREEGLREGPVRGRGPQEDAAADAKWVSLIGSEEAFPESLASDDALAGRVLDSEGFKARISRGGPTHFEDAALARRWVSYAKEPWPATTPSPGSTARASRPAFSRGRRTRPSGRRRGREWVSLIGSEEAFPESLASDDALAGRVLDSEGFKARILARRAYAKGLFEDAALREDAAADAKWVSLIGSEEAFPESPWPATTPSPGGCSTARASRPAFSRGGPTRRACSRTRPSGRTPPRTPSGCR